MAKGQVSAEEYATSAGRLGGIAGLKPRAVLPDSPLRMTSIEAGPETVPSKPPSEARPAVPKPGQVGGREAPARRTIGSPAEAPPWSRPEERTGRIAPSRVFERVNVHLPAEVRDRCEALAKLLQRRKTTKGERFTGNSLVRVGVRILLERLDLPTTDVLNSEEELYEYAKEKLVR